MNIKTLILLTLSATLPLLGQDNLPRGMAYMPKAQFQAKDYSYLLGMKGISNETMNTHFKLYQGYVTNTNTILNDLADYLKEGQEKSVQYAELKRRLMWEYDGVRLHEAYFDNLGGNGKLVKEDALFIALEEGFGSFQAWKQDFIATGAMRGIGWAILYRDPLNGRLTNAWINEHDTGHLVSGNPLLIMDVFEHAYLLDYGIDRMKYIEAFFNNINWDVVSNRFKNATGNQANQSRGPINP